MQSFLVLTKSVTSAGLPGAGAISKARHYKQKRQKNEGPPENMGFNGKPFEGFRRKKRTETILSIFEKKPVEYKDPERIK